MVESGGSLYLWSDECWTFRLLRTYSNSVKEKVCVLSRMRFLRGQLATCPLRSMTALQNGELGNFQIRDLPTEYVLRRSSLPFVRPPKRRAKLLLMTSTVLYVAKVVHQEQKKKTRLYSVYQFLETGPQRYPMCSYLFHAPLSISTPITSIQSSHPNPLHPLQYNHSIKPQTTTVHLYPPSPSPSSPSP